MKFAIIKTGGKQYKVGINEALRIEKIEGAEGGSVSFDEVLMVADEEKDATNVSIGTPKVANAKVSGTILEQGRGDKITVIKYKAKTRHRRKVGHRQHFTKVKITDIKA